ncbi:MAG: Glycine--tRNA ligase 1, mitochondrial [Cirrosporium novae-zelandiae]|nr:MAG: Glycine--tRNA ligase 1, mitochondrial [Cirrosporium novae-zelandiae]
MAPDIPSAKITLDYPLYSADFDPQNHGFLLVGGGGGAGRSGVSNKITLLDTLRNEQISQVVDVELSRDEDSVMSLAAVESTDSSIAAFAGINSSAEDLEAGRNEHLRAFQIDYPPRKKHEKEKNGKPKTEKNENESDVKDSSERALEVPKGITTALGRASLFTAIKQDSKSSDIAYQRVLKLSPPRRDGKYRLGVAASAFAPTNEVVIFNADLKTAESPEVRGRIQLPGKEEAADVDVTESEEEDFHVAYCTDYEVYLYKVPRDRRRKSSLKPKLLYTTPIPDSPRQRPKFRCLRFLAPDLLLLMLNRPGRSGVQLRVLRILGGLDGEVILRKQLRKSTKAAVGLDVMSIPSSSSADKQKQIAVAIAGQDISIEVFTIDYNASMGLSKFKPYAYLKSLHPHPITKICFSYFIPPPNPVTSSTLPRSLKLASVSMGNTAMVHTLPLRPWPSGSHNPRYFLIPPGRSELAQTVFSTIVAFLVVIFSAFLLQAFTEIRGGTPPYLGAVNWLNPGVRDWIAKPYMFGSNNIPSLEKVKPNVNLNIPSSLPKTHILPRSLRHLSDHLLYNTHNHHDNDNGNDPSSSEEDKAILVRDEGTDLTTQIESKKILEKEARCWEDLDEGEKVGWRKRLVDTGRWAADEGETVLKGIFFGSLGGMVGQAAHAGLRR